MKTKANEKDNLTYYERMRLDAEERMREDVSGVFITGVCTIVAVICFMVITLIMFCSCKSTKRVTEENVSIDSVVTNVRTDSVVKKVESDVSLKDVKEIDRKIYIETITEIYSEPDINGKQWVKERTQQTEKHVENELENIEESRNTVEEESGSSKEITESDVNTEKNEKIQEEKKGKFSEFCMWMMAVGALLATVALYLYRRYRCGDR